MKLIDIDLASALQLNNNSSIVPHGNTPPNNVHKQDFPTQDEELVQWATQRFGGVTSFTTVRNLNAISTTGTTGENCFCNLADIRLVYNNRVFHLNQLWPVFASLPDGVSCMMGYDAIHEVRKYMRGFHQIPPLLCRGRWQPFKCFRFISPATADVYPECALCVFVWSQTVYSVPRRAK